MTVPTKKLELLFSDFVDFIKQQTGDTFVNFQSSAYIDRQENYKYQGSRKRKNV